MIKKYLLGIFAIVPMLLFSYVFVGSFTAISDYLPIFAMKNTGLEDWWWGVFVGCTFWTSIIFIVIIKIGTFVPKEKKWLWGSIIFLVNFLVLPFFWWFYIWNTPVSKEKNTN